jgi:NADH-quinone oxidoreductase subunit L
MQVPLAILGALAIVGGFVELPPTLGDRPLFSTFLQPVLPEVATLPARGIDLARLQVVAGIVSLAGIYIAWALFLRSRGTVAALMRQPAGRAVHRFWFAGWGFDWVYDRLFVRPLVWFAAVDRRDAIDRIYDAAAWTSRIAWRTLARSETGRLRWYAAGVTVGAVLVTAIVLFL